MARPQPVRSEIEMDYPLLVSSDSARPDSGADTASDDFHTIQAQGGTFAALPHLSMSHGESAAAAREDLDRRYAQELARRDLEAAGHEPVGVDVPPGDMVYGASGHRFLSSPGFRRAAIGLLVGALALLLIVIILSRTWKKDDGNGGGNNTPVVDRSRKVLVIALDGVRGTAMSAAMSQGKAPNLLKMAQGGAFANCTDNHSPFCAYAHSGPRYSEFPSDPSTPSFQWVTAPGWASTFTGLDNSRHKVKSVDVEDQRVFYNTTRHYPTLMKRVKNTGRKTCAAGLPNFLSRDAFNDSTGVLRGASYGILDFECWPSEDRIPANSASSCNLDRRYGNRYWFNDSADSDSVNFTKSCIGNTEAGDSDLVVIHLDTVDETGHDYGFNDSEPMYLEAIKWVDDQVKVLLDQVDLAAKARNEEWLILVTSDHGGHAKTHKYQYFDDEVIPFFVAVRGPNGYESSAVQPLSFPVRHMDVTPTALAWLLQKTSNLGLDGRVQGVAEFN